MERVIEDYKQLRDTRVAELAQIVVALQQVPTLLERIQRDVRTLETIQKMADNLDEDAIELIGREAIRAFDKVEGYFNEALTQATQWFPSIELLRED